MLAIEEHIIDKITEAIYGLQNGTEVSPVILPEGFPENEIWQLSKYINLLIQQNQIITDGIYAISTGNLNYDLPKSRTGILAAIKSLQSNLRHLTWQTQQVADGDYDQKVDFLGEFSTSFNQMTLQLKSSFNEITQKNNELVELNQKLKETIGTKDKLFSIIGHDLRGPIGNMMSTLSVMVDTEYSLDENQTKEFLQLMKNSSEQTYFLLENLLNWGNSQRGMMYYNPQNNDMNEIIQENLTLFSVTAKNKSTNLCSTIEGKIIGYFDKSLITTVLRNLISNALKFTKPNGNIAISANNKQDYIEIMVADDGVGISEENKKKIFNKDQFFTTPGTGGEKGTGLGLMLCKEFVEKNHGKIWVESEIGKGTTFIFTLPAENIK